MHNSTPFQLHFDPVGDVLASARDCEADVFLDVYGNTRDQLELEYGRYEPTSVFIALADSDNHVVATARLIAPGQPGLKILHDVAEEPWSVDADASCRAAGIDVDRAWEIATLSVRRGIKGTGSLAAVAIYHGIGQTILANSVGTIMMIMDRRARTLLNAVSLVQHALPGTGPRPYLGSAESTPLYSPCPEFLDTQRRLNPDAHRLITMGVGLDGISVPPRSAFALKRGVRELALVPPISQLANTA